MNLRYEDFDFKIPLENSDYQECSDFVIHSVESIIQAAIVSGQNKIIINTNLKRGLPMENINKVAGPFVEAWAFETFYAVFEDSQKNSYQLVNVEAQERLSQSDIVLQFQKSRRSQSSITAEVDVKATAEDLEKSGRSPNITSFARIRTAYVQEPDLIFVILSLKHKVYSAKDKQTGLMNGVMEVVAHQAYDLKFLSAKDLSYNPALGTGQIQIKDIHYVSLNQRTAWDFCQLLDRKYLSSTRRDIQQWYRLAVKYGWIKIDE